MHKQVNTKWIGPGEAGEGAHHLYHGVMESHVVVCAELASSLPHPAGCPGGCRGGWEKLGSLQPSNPGLSAAPRYGQLSLQVLIPLPRCFNKKTEVKCIYIYMFIYRERGMPQFILLKIYI